MINLDLSDNLAKIPKGYGYWDLRRYPWGGDFHRFATDVCLPIVRVVSQFTDGSPRQIIVKSGDAQLGIQL